MNAQAILCYPYIEQQFPQITVDPLLRPGISTYIRNRFQFTQNVKQPSGIFLAFEHDMTNIFAYDIVLPLRNWSNASK